MKSHPPVTDEVNDQAESILKLINAYGISIPGAKVSKVAKESFMTEIRSLLSNKKPTIEYRHISTGNIYTFVSYGKAKFNGKWYDSVNYQDEKGEPFTRILEDFNSKFTLIEDENAK